MSYSESSMSLRAGAWVRMECWAPEVSVTSVETDCRVRYWAGGECRLRAKRALKVRRAEGCGRGWSIRRRVADDGRNISSDD